MTRAAAEGNERTKMIGNILLFRGVTEGGKLMLNHSAKPSEQRKWLTFPDTQNIEPNGKNS